MPSSTSPSTKIGVVPYINALPLYYYFGRPVQKEVPSKLIELLLLKRLDLALIPAFAFLDTPALHPILEAGVIQSLGPVESVCLFYDKKLASPKDITSLSITTDSVTSINLFKVIYSTFWGKNFDQLVIKTTKHINRLEIGDKALFFERHGQKKLDLGEEWTKNTGLPFVFALWACHGSVDQQIIQELIIAKKKGIANCEQIALNLTQYPIKKVLPYLTKSIHYEITRPGLQGLKKFQDYCFELGLVKEKRHLGLFETHHQPVNSI